MKQETRKFAKIESQDVISDLASIKANKYGLNGPRYVPRHDLQVPEYFQNLWNKGKCRGRLPSRLMQRRSFVDGHQILIPAAEIIGVHSKVDNRKVGHPTYRIREGIVGEINGGTVFLILRCNLRFPIAGVQIGNRSIYYFSWIFAAKTSKSDQFFSNLVSKMRGV